MTLLDERCAKRERKEQQAKATSVQQPKQAAPVADRDTLWVWVEIQAARMKPVPQSAETKNLLDDWKFEKRG